MKTISRAVVFILLLNQCLLAGTKKEIKIALKNNDPKEIQTKQQLERLLKNYDLSKWIFTTDIVIDKDAIPHSHPILTLHTRHLKDDELLLSTFVHEQIHWFITQNEKQTEAAVNELKILFPKVPVGYPDGAEDEYGSYIHFIVNYLEYRSDKELLGELKARQIMEFWSTDHYRWIYRQMLENEGKIRGIVFKNKLII